MEVEQMEVDEGFFKEEEDEGFFEEETELDVYSVENIEQLLLENESFRYFVIHNHYSEIVNTIKKYYAIDYRNVINSK